LFVDDASPAGERQGPNRGVYTVPVASPSAPVAIQADAEQASSAATCNPTPIFIIGGALLAAALVWFIRPVRAVVALLVSRKDHS
jgi:hypothetical protein